ncbi:hypothetical protein ACH5RR_015440 [Cinchona calisaya]|uniref:RNase H type-1 domain-containing protein n=1 Tax=Cinchona calisaya TaxID=153742 RepID=A0ABD2ZT71_9GENT
MQMIPSRPRYVSVTWMATLHGWYTLNTDGAPKENPVTTLGGIIRDSSGSFVVGFSNYYGHGSNLQAEMKASLDGISLYTTMGLYNVAVELDSHILVNIITNSASCPWLIDNLMQLFWSKSQALNFTCGHIFCEANHLADYLANEDYLNKSNSLYNHFSLLVLLRACCS